MKKYVIKFKGSSRIGGGTYSRETSSEKEVVKIISKLKVDPLYSKKSIKVYATKELNLREWLDKLRSKELYVKITNNKS